MKPLRTFFMEEVLESRRFTAKFNLAESGSRPSSVGELLVGTGLSPQAAADELLCTSLRDSPNWGRDDLRGLVAGLHPGSSPKEVLITTGTSEALMLLFRALRPAKTALIWPAFQLLYEIPVSLGSSIVRLPVRWDHSGTPLLDHREWIRILERERPDCVVLNFPHNPSGLQPSSEVLHELVDRALAIGAFVIGDEHYRFLASDDSPLGPTVFRPSDRVFATGSYIKCLGCPGLRIGWCVTANLPVLEAMQSEKNYLTHTVNPLSESISVAVLRDLDAPIWNVHRDTWRRNRDSLGRFLTTSQGFVGSAPRGGLVTCLGFRRARWRNQAEAAFAAIRRAEVSVLPLQAMEVGTDNTEANDAIGQGFGFRLGLGAQPENFAHALLALEQACLAVTGADGQW